MARRRTVKSTPKRGKLTRRKVRQVVKQVVQEMHAEKAMTPTQQADATASESKTPSKTA